MNDLETNPPPTTEATTPTSETPKAMAAAAGAGGSTSAPSSSPPIRTLAKGTKVKIHERELTLVEDTQVEFDASEQTFVGMLTLSGNLQVNQHLLDKQYDNLGRPVE
jgi:hypothetical protein